MEAPALSIVIPVYNRANFTASCLKDLFLLSDQPQIIVVDNASTDTTQQELSTITHPGFAYIRNETNLGFGKACNIGYANSTGRKVMFLNNDIRVRSNHSDWIRPILDLLDREPKTLVGPTGGFVDPKTFDFRYETKDPNTPFNYLSGWCFSADRESWDILAQEAKAIGPFCPDYFVFYEDTHLSWVATRLGFKLKLLDIPVVHFGHTSSKQLNTAKLYQQSRQIFIDKWSKKQ
jgi:GT2 family glycosyltransferase